MEKLVNEKEGKIRRPSRNGTWKGGREMEEGSSEGDCFALVIKQGLEVQCHWKMAIKKFLNNSIA